MRYELGKDKAAADKYKGLRHDTERLDILAKYIIDPSDVSDAEIIAAECESRDSPYEGMRKAGKKEYLVELSEEIWERLNNDEAQLKSRS